MAIFRKNGFIRKQEIAFARKLLVWQYQTTGKALPDEAALSAHAEKVVKEAHMIAEKSGHNIMEIIKSRLKDIQKR